MIPPSSVKSAGRVDDALTVGTAVTGQTAAPARLGRWPWWAPLALLLVPTTILNGIRVTALAPEDLIRFAAAGQAILDGRFGEPYADPWMQAGPFELLGSWVLLPQGHQHDMSFWQYSHPTAAVLSAAMAGVLAIGMVLGYRWLRRWAGRGEAPGLLLTALAIAQVLRLPEIAWDCGHLAQLAIPLHWLAAGLLIRRGRPLAAAVLIGTSGGWELWGVLGAPVLMIDRTPPPLIRLAVRFVLAGVTATLVYLPFVLSGHFTLFAHRWPVFRGAVVSLVLPEGSPVGWAPRVLQAAATVLVAAVVAYRTRHTPDAVWLVPLAAQLVRLLLDPLDLGYYWLPVLLLGLAGVAMVPAGAHPWRLPATIALVVAPSAHLLTRSWQAPSTVGTVVLLTAPPLLALVTVLVARDDSSARMAGCTSPSRWWPSPSR